MPSWLPFPRPPVAQEHNQCWLISIEGTGCQRVPAVPRRRIRAPPAIHPGRVRSDCILPFSPCYRACRSTRGSTGKLGIKAHITGTIFKVERKAGERVASGEAVVVIESMKMEIPVESPVAGTVREVRVGEGVVVEEGAVVAVVDPD